MAKKVAVVPAEPILDRVFVSKSIKDDLREPVSYLEVLVDEGVQLLKRALLSSDREIPDVVLLPVLFRQVLAFLDAVHVHLLAGAVYTAVPDLRAMFEASLAMEWILTGPLDRKESREVWRDRWARQYYVAELRQERDSTRQFVPRTPACANLRKVAPDLVKELQSDPQRVAAARQRVKDIGRHIQRFPELRRINSRFGPLRRKLRDQEPAWYRVGGPSSLAQMAQQLGRADEYRILYKQWSEVAHGSRTKPHIQLKAKTLVIEPIRSVGGLDGILTLSTMIAERSLHMIFAEYRPDELKRFAEKRQTIWREKRNVPEISVNTQVLNRV